MSPLSVATHPQEALLLTTYYLLPTIYYLLPTTHPQEALLLTTYYLLLTTYYLLLTTYHASSSARFSNYSMRKLLAACSPLPTTRYLRIKLTRPQLVASIARWRHDFQVVST